MFDVHLLVLVHINITYVLVEGENPNVIYLIKLCDVTFSSSFPFFIL